MGKRKKKKSTNAGLPELFKERIEQILSPSDLISTLSSYSKERHTTLRINTLKTDPITVQKWLQQNGIQFKRHPLLDIAFILPNTSSREATEFEIYKNGEIYLQNLSSMVPPIVLNPKPGETVLDLTAAPGSKTTQMAAMMQRKGKLVANDKAFPRFKRLEANCQMQVGEDFVDAIGAAPINVEEESDKFIQIHNKAGEVFGKQMFERFDKVLIDAPCSSEGQFSLLKPKTLQYWSRHKIKDMCFKQNKLLYSAILACKPGGTIVYSTCTFAPEENEQVLNKMLKKFAGVIELVEIDGVVSQLKNARAGITKWQDKELSQSVKKSRRIIPTQEFEGFFVAKIKKLTSVTDIENN